MKEYVVRVKQFLDKLLNVGHAVYIEENESELIDLIKKAHREWEIAVNNFNYCLGQDMIDYSIYNMEAAEKKYICLVKMARKENLTANLPNNELEWR